MVCPTSVAPSASFACSRQPDFEIAHAATLLAQIPSLYGGRTV